MSNNQEISLRIDGRIHTGWTSASISMAINSLCSSFDLSLRNNHPIYTGQLVELYIGDVLILTGYIDSKSGGTSASGNSLRIAGRDKTADLIDCAAIYKLGSWKGQNLLQIASDLCEPFGIKAFAETNVGAPFTIFSIEPGESVFECLSRAAKLRGVLLTSSPEGNLIIYKPVPNPVSWALELGKNIEGINYSEDAKDRFSQYIIKGQHHGNEDNTSKLSSAAKGYAFDKTIIRYRPKIIISDEQSTAIGLNTRAAFEATAAAANGQSVDIVMPSWLTPLGNLWSLNLLVPIRADIHDINMSLMVSEIEFSQDENSRETRLKFVRPESFAPEPLPVTQEPIKKNGGLKK